jgi:hypothetical protein
VLPTTERTVRDLNALVRIGTSIGSLQSVDAIAHKLLESVFEIVPAEHGAVVLFGEDVDDFASVVSGHRLPDAGGPIQVSRTATSRAARGRLAPLTNDVLEEEAFSQSESLRLRTRRSLTSADWPEAITVPHTIAATSATGPQNPFVITCFLLCGKRMSSACMARPAIQARTDPKVCKP